MNKRLPILRNDTLIVKDGESFVLYSPFRNLITRIKDFPTEGTSTESELRAKGFFKSLPETIKPLVE